MAKDKNANKNPNPAAGGTPTAPPSGDTPPAGGTPGAPAGATPPPATAAATKAPRVAPVITGVLAATAVPMPERVVNRGSKTNYPFDSLANVGDSFGVVNKTAANLQPIVATQNRKPGAIKKDANGLPIVKGYLDVEMKDAAGTVIGKMPGNANNGAEIDYDRLPQKKYFALDVDAKTDPQGASVRVWREA